MSMTDPIADMLTRIRNAIRIGRESVDIPLSKAKTGVAQVLQQEGYIKTFKTIEDELQGRLRVYLKYTEEGTSVISDIRRVSTPGCRVYRGIESMPKVLNGMGITIYSTSKGIMSDRDCRKAHIGGECMCSVY